MIHQVESQLSSARTHLEGIKRNTQHIECGFWADFILKTTVIPEMARVQLELEPLAVFKFEIQLAEHLKIGMYQHSNIYENSNSDSS